MTQKAATAYLTKRSMPRGSTSTLRKAMKCERVRLRGEGYKPAYKERGFNATQTWRDAIAAAAYRAIQKLSRWINRSRRPASTNH